MGGPAARRVRGSSFLATYNFDFHGRPFPDGTGASRSEGELWERALAWSRALVSELGITRETLKLGKGLNARLERCVSGSLCLRFASAHTSCSRA